MEKERVREKRTGPLLHPDVCAAPVWWTHGVGEGVTAGWWESMVTSRPRLAQGEQQAAEVTRPIAVTAPACVSFLQHRPL